MPSSSAAAYALWKRELETPTPEADRHNRENDPKLLNGWWRIHASRTKTDWPVLIWTNADAAENPTGATILQIGGDVINTAEHGDRFDKFLQTSWLKCTAVTRAEYEAAQVYPAPGTTDGRVGRWADGKPARKMTLDELLNIEVPKAGANQAPLDELYAEQIKALAEKMVALEVTDQDTADLASGMDDAMRRLIQLATDAFDAEKAPVRELAKEIDGKWRVARDPGEQARERVIARRDTWLRAETKRQQAIAAEENRKRAAEAEAAQEAARAAAIKEATQHGLEVDEAEIAARVAEVVPPVQEVTAPKVTAGSATGRSTSVKKVPVAPITDVLKLVQHFLDTNDGNFIDYMRERAKKAQKAKITLPGVEFFADDADWQIEKAKREAAKPGVPAEFEEPKSNG